jgi:hypothetical protein
MHPDRALTQAQTVSMTEWTVMREQAAMLVKTGFLPESIKTPEQAVAIILQGREIGIPTMAALQTINVIKGKPTVSPQLMLALIYRSKQVETLAIEEETETRCVVLMKRKGQPAHRESFTIEDARKITTSEYENGQKKSVPLADKYNWRSMPKTMLKWRAIAACSRVVFPDVVLGLYTPEEMGAEVEVTEDGQVLIASGAASEARTITPEGEVLDAMRGRLAPEMQTWGSLEPEANAPDQLSAPNAAEVLNRAMDNGIDGYQQTPEPAPDNSGPAPAEHITRYKELIATAQALKIDVAPFAIEADTITRARIIQLGSRLKAVIEAKQAAGAPA